MSFSAELKDDLLREPMDRACCIRAEIAALTQACASLEFRGGGRFSVTYRTESKPLARRLFQLLKTEGVKE